MNQALKLFLVFGLSASCTGFIQQISKRTNCISLNQNECQKFIFMAERGITLEVMSDDEMDESVQMSPSSLSKVSKSFEVDSSLKNSKTLDNNDIVYSEIGLKKVLQEIDLKIEESKRAREAIEIQQSEAQRMKSDIRSASKQKFEEKRRMTSDEIPNKFANGTEQTVDAKQRQRLPLPLFNIEFGFKGGWEEIGGNFLLKPPEGATVRGVIHFLGGAFVGAAPHITYRYLLNGLAEVGFVVVATPYSLGFDYLKVCDSVLEQFEKAALPLAEEYGALPVIGVGHSCGALLQLLITCLFPDTPRAANALISFNNMPVKQAVPAFDEVVLPLVTQFFTANSPPQKAAEALWETRGSVYEALEALAKMQISPLSVETELLPLAKQALQIIEQLPPLFKEVADGAREFSPTPEEVQEVVRRMYRARRTLVVRFENDSIDESEDVKKVIQAGKTLLRMRRPMVDMDLRYEVLTGTHITPLTQDVFALPTANITQSFESCSIRKQARQDFLRTVNDLGQVLVEWLEEGLVLSQYNPQ